MRTITCDIKPRSEGKLKPADTIRDQVGTERSQRVCHKCESVRISNYHPRKHNPFPVIRFATASFVLYLPKVSPCSRLQFLFLTQTQSIIRTRLASGLRSRHRSSRISYGLVVETQSAARSSTNGENGFSNSRQPRIGRKQQCRLGLLAQMKRRPNGFDD